MTSGLRLYKTAAAKAMAAVESRGDGSNNRFSSCKSGNCSETAEAWLAPVTTMIWEPAIGDNLSQVSCNRV